MHISVRGQGLTSTFAFINQQWCERHCDVRHVLNHFRYGMTPHIPFLLLIRFESAIHN